MRRWCAGVILAAAILAFAVACIPPGERGGTYAEFDADTCAFTIHLNMAFWGDGKSQAQVDGWVAAINTFWNGKDLKVSNCPLRFVVTGTTVASAADCPPERHCIQVKQIAAGTSHTSFVNVVGTNGDGVPNGWKSTDKGTQIDSTTAEWDNGDTNQVAIHESAHLLGLDDEYRPGDVACAAADCVTKVAWGEMSVPQAHVDALAAAAGLRCPCVPTPTPTPGIAATPTPAATGTPGVALGVTVDVISSGGARVPVRMLRVAEADRCPERHYHGPGRALDAPFAVVPDPNPEGCGHGAVPSTPVQRVTIDRAAAAAFTLATGVALP